MQAHKQTVFQRSTRAHRWERDMATPRPCVLDDSSEDEDCHDVRQVQAEAGAPTLERELMMEFGLEASAARATEAKLRSQPATAMLTGTTLGDLRHAVDTSVAGDLFRELTGLRRVAQSDADIERLLGNLRADSKSSFRRANRESCLQPTLRRLFGARSRTELAARARALTVGLEGWPDHTELQQLANHGAFRQDPDAFSRLCMLQQLTQMQIFPFRLQRAPGGRLSAQLADAAQRVASGMHAVVPLTHVTAKQTLQSAVQAAGLGPDSVVCIIDEEQSEVPEPGETAGPAEEHSVDFLGAMAEAAARRLITEERRQQLALDFEALQEAGTPDLRRHELLQNTRRATQDMSASFLEHLAPHALARQLLVMRDRGLYAHQPRLTQLQVLQKVDAILARAHPALILQLVLPCGGGKGDLIALLTQRLLLTSPRPLLVVVCTPQSNNVDDLASRMLPFLHTVPAHVYLPEKARGIERGRGDRLASACGLARLAPPVAPHARATRRLDGFASLASRCILCTATPRDRPSCPVGFVSVKACWKSAVAQGECLATREVNLTYDLVKLRALLSGASAEVGRLAVAYLDAKRAAGSSAPEGGAPKSGASTEELDDQSVRRAVMAFARARYKDGGRFTQGDLYAAMTSSSCEKERCLRRYKTPRDAKHGLSKVLSDWHRDGDLRLRDRSGSEHVYDLPPSDPADAEGYEQEDEPWALAAMAATLLVHARRQGLRKGFCFTRSNDRAEFLARWIAFLTSTSQGKSMLSAVDAYYHPEDPEPWDLPTECASTSRCHSADKVRALTAHMAQGRGGGVPPLLLTVSTVLNSEGTNVVDLEFVCLMGVPFRAHVAFLLQLLSRANREGGGKRWSYLVKLLRWLPPSQTAEVKVGKITAKQRRQRQRMRQVSKNEHEAMQATVAVRSTPAAQHGLAALAKTSRDGGDLPEEPLTELAVVVGTNQNQGRRQPSLENLAGIYLGRKVLKPERPVTDGNFLVINGSWQKPSGDERKRLGAWLCSGPQVCPGEDSDAYWLYRSDALKKRDLTFASVLEELRYQFSLGAEGDDACAQGAPPASRAKSFEELYKDYLVAVPGLREIGSGQYLNSTSQQYWSVLRSYCEQHGLGAPARTRGFHLALLRAERETPPQDKPTAIRYAIEFLELSKKRNFIALEPSRAAKQRRVGEEDEAPWRRLYLACLELKGPETESARKGYVREVQLFCRKECRLDVPPIDQPDLEALVHEKYHEDTYGRSHRDLPTAVKRYVELLTMRREGNDARYSNRDDILPLRDILDGIRGLELPPATIDNYLGALKSASALRADGAPSVLHQIPLHFALRGRYWDGDEDSAAEVHVDVELLLRLCDRVNHDGRDPQGVPCTLSRPFKAAVRGALRNHRAMMSRAGPATRAAPHVGA